MPSETASNDYQALAALVVELYGISRMTRDDFIKTASTLSPELAHSDRAWASYLVISQVEDFHD
jgi:hypothetical protein